VFKGSARGADAHFMKARLAVPVALVVVIVLLVTVVRVALDSSGPSSAAAAGSTPVNVRGTWNTLVSYDGSLFMVTVHINDESAQTGAFSGTVASPVGRQAIAGKATGSMVSFTIRFGTGVESGNGQFTSSPVGARITGTFANESGGTARILATRSA
jgi:hypothetical protein